jgi:hypothetical protein
MRSIFGSTLTTDGEMQRGILMITTVLFGVLSALALANHGYWGIIAPHFRTFGAGQVFADLVISLSLVMMWIWNDAKKLGRATWPWLVLTLVAGSFGPLIYLLTRQQRAGLARAPAPAMAGSRSGAGG